MAIGLVEILLKLVGDNSSAKAMLRDSAAEVAAYGAAADAAAAKSDNLGAKTDDLTVKVRESGSAISDLTTRHRALKAGMDATADAVRDGARVVGDAEQGVKDLGKATEDAGGALKDTGKAADDAGKSVKSIDDISKGFADTMGKVESIGNGVGKVLGFLGTTGGAGQKGVAGMTSAMDGATTSFSTFLPLVGQAGHATVLFSMAMPALMVGLVGVGLVLAPLIISIASFTVALTAAIAVMAIGVGGAFAVVGGMTALAAATGNLTKPLQELQKAYKSVADTLGKEVAPLASQVIVWLTGWAPVLLRMGQGIVQVFGQILGPTLHIATLFVNDLLNALTQLGYSFRGVINYVLDSQGKFNGLFQQILGVGTGAINGLLMNLVKLSQWFFNTLPTFEPLIGATFGFIGTVLYDVIKFVGNLGLAFAGIFEGVKDKEDSATTFGGALQQIGLSAKNATKLLDDFGKAFALLKSLIEPAVKVVVDFGKGFISTFLSSYSGGGFEQMLDRLHKDLPPFLKALDGIAKTVGQVAGEITSADLFQVFEQALPTIVQFATILLEKLTPAIKTLGDFFVSHYQIFVAMGIAFVGFKIATGAIDSFNNLAGGIKGTYEAAGKAVDNFNSMKKAVGDAVSKVGEWLGITNEAKDAQEGQTIATEGATAAEGEQAVATEGEAAAQTEADVAMDANPIGLIILAIAALIAIIVLVVTHWKQVHAVITEVWDKLKDFASWVKGELGDAFSELGTKVHNAINDLLGWVKDHWMLLALATGPFLAPIILLIGAIITHWSEIKRAFQKGVDDVWSVLRPWVTFFEQLWSVAFTVVRALVQLFTLGVRNLFQDLVNNIKGVVGPALTWLQDAWHDATSFVWNLLVKFWNDEKQGWQTIFDWLRDLVQAALAWIRQLWTDHLSYVWNFLVDHFFNPVKQGFTDALQFVRQLVSDALMWLQTTFGDRLNYIWNLLSDAFGLWKTGFSEALNDIKNTVSGWVSDIETFFTNLLTNIGTTVGKIASNIGSAIYGGLLSAIQDVDNFIAGINGLLKTVGVQPISYIGNIKKGSDHTVESFATGGILAGGVTNGPFLIGEGMGGGEYVIPTAPQHRSRALGLWADAGDALGAGVHGLGALVGNASGAVSSAASMLGTIGGQCVVFLERILNTHWPVAYAAQMASMVTTHSPVVGDVGVSTIPPYGHAFLVAPGNMALDSNWVAPLTVGLHALSQIPDIAGFFNPGASVDMTGLTSTAGGILGALLSGPENALKSLVGKIPGLAGQIASGVLGSVFNGINGLTASGTSGTAGTNGSTAGAATTAQVLGWIQAAEALTGVGPNWTSGLSTIIHYESGGNPTIDQSGLTGFAQAHGIMQMINSTFAAYALSGHTNIYNPIDNIASAIEYIKARYGTPANTPGLLALSAGGGYHGYGVGGVAMTPQIAALAENGPEMVTPMAGPGSLQQWFQQSIQYLQEMSDYLATIAAPRPATVSSFQARLRHAG